MRHELVSSFRKGNAPEGYYIVRTYVTQGGDEIGDVARHANIEAERNPTTGGHWRATLYWQGAPQPIDLGYLSLPRMGAAESLVGAWEELVRKDAAEPRRCPTCGQATRS